MKNIFLVVGAVLAIVGVLGFVMGDNVFGFQVNALHNVIHLVTGGALLWAAMKGAAEMSLVGKVFGVIYALVTVVGFTMGGDIFGLMMVNTADNVLHAALAILLLYVGFAPARAAQAI
jgi:hypothetical protein